MKRLISLLAAMAAVVLLSTPAFAQSSYTWQLDCTGAAIGGVAGTGVTWYWLHDGAQIAEAGFVSCASVPPLYGSGEIPATINEMQVNGIEIDASLDEYPAFCTAFNSVRKSIDLSNLHLSIKLRVSAPAYSGSKNRGTPCPNAGFQFKME